MDTTITEIVKKFSETPPTGVTLPEFMGLTRDEYYEMLSVNVPESKKKFLRNKVKRIWNGRNMEILF
jgi:hypothetical protein